MKILLLVVLCLLLTGCANPGIVKTSPNTYMISREDHGGIFGNAARMKANVISNANDFAESQGKVVVPISTNERPMRPWVPAGWATIEYQFKIVDKNDPEARGASLIPKSNVIINKPEKVSADILSKDLSEKQPDLYADLMKLDDLRKKGLITDAEFEAQKKILLNKQR